ncbi:MAG TPA: hypothetical protein VIS10_15875 [Anaerolineales bacterium]
MITKFFTVSCIAGILLLLSLLLSFWHYFFVLGAPAFIFVITLLFGIGLVSVAEWKPDTSEAGSPVSVFTKGEIV